MRYGVSIAGIFGKIYHVMMAPQCVQHLLDHLTVPSHHPSTRHLGHPYFSSVLPHNHKQIDGLVQNWYLQSVSNGDTTSCTNWNDAGQTQSLEWLIMVATTSMEDIIYILSRIQNGEALRKLINNVFSHYHFKISYMIDLCTIRSRFV